MGFRDDWKPHSSGVSDKRREGNTIKRSQREGPTDAYEVRAENVRRVCRDEVALALILRGMSRSIHRKRRRTDRRSTLSHYTNRTCLGSDWHRCGNFRIGVHCEFGWHIVTEANSQSLGQTDSGDRNLRSHCAVGRIEAEELRRHTKFLGACQGGTAGCHRYGSRESTRRYVGREKGCSRKFGACGFHSPELHHGGSGEALAEDSDGLPSFARSGYQ